MISDNDRNNLISEMSDWYGVFVTEAQMQDILDKTPELVKEIESMGVDTCVREWTIDLIGKFIGMNRRWPLNMDDRDYAEAFFKEFLKKGQDFGLHFSFNWKAHE